MNETSDLSLLPDRLRHAFATRLPVPPITERHLGEALSETLARTGNLIRAQLAYGVARAYGSAHETSLQLATALEYFHTASLLFDDLPGMDDATHRRGAVCVHHVYGEGTAILSALALINRAYALIWKTAAGADLPTRDAALAYVELHLGLGGLLNGQSHDLHYSRLPLAERSPQQVAMGKTVPLIRLSLVLPAVLGAAPGRVLHWLDRLAVFWGLAYQAVDDLKDVLHETERAGKTTDRDTLLDRPNLAVMQGVSATTERLHKLVLCSARFVARLQKLNPSLLCLDGPQRRLEMELAGFRGQPVGALP